MRRSKRWAFEQWSMHSKYEYNIAKDLRERGVDFEYEAKSFKYVVQVTHTYCESCGAKPAVKQASYTPDFFLPNGIIVEAKGRWDSADRKKMAAMAEQYPELDIRMLFLANNWLTKRHKESYGSWCEKKGIKYHVGTTVPQEWIDA